MSLQTSIPNEPKCRNCGEIIQFFPNMPTEELGWIHADGLYTCRRSRPSPKTTYAEPNVGSDILEEEFKWRR